MTTSTSFDAWQTTFILSLLSNAASGKVLTSGTQADAVTTFTTDLTADVKAGISTYLNSEWTLAWGPAVYVRATAAPYTVTNAAYVAFNQTANRYVLAIAATDPVSLFDWSGEDFDINPAVAFNDAVNTWTGSEGTASNAGHLTQGTVVGIGNVLALNPGDQTLLSYLQGVTLSAGQTFTVTGHSLGGALSPVMAVSLTQINSKTFNGKNVLAYPTAGATPGDKSFAKFFSATLPPITGAGASGTNTPWQVWNVDQWNQFDVVPSAWQMDTLNLIIQAYQTPVNTATQQPEYGSTVLNTLTALSLYADTKIGVFFTATGQFPARLSPAFEVLLPDAATAWVAWPGCLNGQATAQDSFVWDLNGSEVAWGQIPSSQQAQATATLMPLQALYQHVKFYSDFILGPGVFVMPNITSSSGSAAA